MDDVSIHTRMYTDTVHKNVFRLTVDSSLNILRGVLSTYFLVGGCEGCGLGKIKEIETVAKFGSMRGLVQ